MHTSIFKLQFLYFFLFLGGGGGKKIIDTFSFTNCISVLLLMWQFFQTKYHFYQGVFKNNENSLILQRKKRYHFQKMADKIQDISINFRDIGTFFCVYNVGSDLNLHLLEEPSQ